MQFRKIKKFLANVKYWPIHPQWFVFLHVKKYCRSIGLQAKGLVLDIGCADQYIKYYLTSGQDYLGLDYYKTSTKWYKTHPHVYGDAQALPVAGESVDTVLLLDVLEHLPNPDKSLQEIKRVLKIEGLLIISVPFLYPLHDEPLDFQRWTQHGLLKLAKRHGFQLKSINAWGHPLETSALISNIALSKTLLNWLQQRNPLSLLGILLPFIIVFINISAYILARISPRDTMLPHGYRLVMEKR